MRLELRFKAVDGYIPLDYRPFVMSFFKGSLSRLYKNVFDEMYSKDNLKPKSFTFGVYLGKSELKKDRFILANNEFKVIISSYDYSTIMYMYNSLLLNRRKEFRIPLNTSVILESVRITDIDNIKGEIVKIKFISPLLVRSHTESGDIYLDYQAPDFNEKLNIVVSNFVNTLNIEELKGKKIILTPIKPKKTIVKNMNLYFPASFGEYELKGDEKLLNYLLSAGIGSRRGEGFGLFIEVGEN